MLDKYNKKIWIESSSVFAFE